MIKQRTLNDLFQLSTPVTFDDGKGPVTVWLVKLDPLDYEAARRGAAAVRARIRAEFRDEGSDESLAQWDEIDVFTDEDLIGVVAGEDRQRITARAEAEVAFDDEWKEEGYLQGLVDAWRGGLQQRWEDDPDDAEAARVWSEMKRYNQAVSDYIEREFEERKRVYAELARPELEKKAFDALVKLRCDLAWFTELGRQEIFYATRQAVPVKAAEGEEGEGESTEPGERYFKNVEAVARLNPVVFNRLHGEYRDLVVGPTEGKDLPGTPASSASSEPSEQEETAELSGPLVAVP